MNTNNQGIEFYSTQSINQEDKDSVLEALSSGVLSRGPKIKEFEKALGDYCKNPKVLAVNSATSALQLAYQVNGISKNSIVWASPLTFVATINAAVHFGADVDFVDIDPFTLNICPTMLKRKLEEAKFKSRLPDFVTIVHFGGNPCDLEEIFNLSKIYNFCVIEDASHALGANYHGSQIGSNKFSDSSIFSFHPVKMITTGEGGALFVNTEKQLERATKLRSHGIEKQTTKSEKKEFEWYYEQTELGYNFRMSEIQAALGTSQMDRLEYFVRKRNYLASLYKDRLSKVPLKLQTVDPNSLSSYHLFTVEITDPRFSRNLLYKYLRNNKIGCQVHYIPVHLQPFYKNKGFSAGQFENAELYYKNCLSIPLHQGLNEDDIEIVCEKLFSFFNGDC